jgi:hypothetical protein
MVKKSPQIVTALSHEALIHGVQSRRYQMFNHGSGMGLVQ